MNTLNIPTLRTANVNTDSILVVGFDKIAYGVLTKYKNGSRRYRLKQMESPFKAYYWLKNLALDGFPEDFPRAIICDLQFLQDDNYRLLNQLSNNENLKDLPFIVMSTNGATIDTSFALKKGIDDCFELNNLNWSNLKRRIEFLTRFKSEIANGDTKINEVISYKIPTGKRIFDVVFASACLLVLSPLMILIAILVKLESKGNIFYTSKRAGSGFQVFDFIKFRSMYPDADRRLKELEHLNQYEGNTDDGPSFVKLQNDPRVTKVGRLIRKTSIDELPQLFNVLKGDMSIVGNRPLPLYEAEQLINDEWSQRFIAPAGLTGLWQISKRGKKDMSTQERIQLDIDYANDYSLWMDMKILMRTLPAMIQDEQV